METQQREVTGLVLVESTFVYCAECGQEIDVHLGGPEKEPHYTKDGRPICESCAILH